MEIPIVDNSDKIIGFKERDKIKQRDIYRVSALWVQSNQGDILLAQRAFSKKNSPGKFGPAVAGTVEKGETYDSNIVKEAREEIGLKDSKVQKRKKLRIRGKHNYFCQMYFVMLPKSTKFIINKDEVASIRWFTKKELLEEFKAHPEKFVRNTVRYLKSFKENSNDNRDSIKNKSKKISQRS